VACRACAQFAAPGWRPRLKAYWGEIAPTTDSLGSDLLCRLRRGLSGHGAIPDRVRARAQYRVAAQGCGDDRTGGMKNRFGRGETLRFQADEIERRQRALPRVDDHTPANALTARQVNRDLPSLGCDASP
jgi:hypothetical protein